MEQSYRIRTNIGEDQVVKTVITQDINFLEILSLKINQVDVYKQHTSNYGVIAGRVLANEAFGIPNAKISVFIELSDEDEKNTDITQFYPYTTIRTQDSDGIRYNLLPDSSNDDCYREVGTFPNKRLVLDNDTLIEVFDKYWKYTTVTNNSGDYMIFGVPTGNHQVHVDIDLSDIGILSQKPRDFMYKGYNITQFDNASQFKESTNLDNLSQLISQDTSVHVYPFWGSSDNEEIAISRCDIQIQYKFEPTCVFFGSIVSDNFSNNIGHKCNPSKYVGFNRNLVAGEGTIEMIRKTPDGLIEEFQIQGNQLIDGDGVWCYQIPMNLDYVQTNEYGQIVPSDNGKGLATRTSVRFRISMRETDSEGVSRHRAKYLVPNVHNLDEEVEMPQIKEPNKFEQCFEFGSATPDEFFRDLYWNKVYTVKNYIPRIQINGQKNTQKYSAIRTVNDSGNLNPFPFNHGRFRLVFGYRVLCVLMSIIFKIMDIVNTFLSSIICLEIRLPFKIRFRPFKFLCGAVKCIAVRGGLTEDEDSNVEYFPGCKRGCDCMMKCEEPGCQKEVSYTTLMDITQQNLSQEYDIVNLDFYNDWVNGCLYMPLWFWRKTKKKKYLFGLFSRKAVNTYCNCDKNYPKLRVAEGCALEWANPESGGYNGGNGGSKYDRNFAPMPRTFYGIVKEVENNAGLKVYYYTPGVPNNDTYKTNTEVSSYIRLYSTDIVLLGSLNECDLDNLPRPFINLPSTTANVPYIATLKSTATDDSDSDSTLEGTTIEEGGTVEVTGMDWTDRGKNHKPRYGEGLLLDLTCVKVSTKPKTCINLERMSELGVSLDINVERAIPENGRIKYDTTQTADGMITRYEIVDNETRAMFASLNHNGLTKKMKNNSTGYDTYKLAYIYPTDFNGKMDVEARAYTSMMKVKTRDNADKEYINYRLGRVPYKKGGETKLSKSHFYSSDRSFPLYNNSFFFYFGLNEGNTAIDKFNNMFYATCYKNTKYPFTLTYTSKPAKWCKTNTENDYATIDITFKGIQVPYSYTLYNNFGDEIANCSADGVYDTSLVFGTDKQLENGTYIIEVIDSSGKSIKQTININQVLMQAEVSTIALGDKYYGDADSAETRNSFCQKNLAGEIIITNINVDGLKYCISSINKRQTSAYTLNCSLLEESETGVTVNNSNTVKVDLTITSDDETVDISKVMCGNGPILNENINLIFKIWRLGTYNLTFNQMCGNEFTENEYTMSAIIENGEPFNSYVNEVPFKFLSKLQPNGFNNGNVTSATQVNGQWFDLLNPISYSFPPIAANQIDVWNDFVEVESMQDNSDTNAQDGENKPKALVLNVNSALNIMNYEIESMFKMAKATYIVDDNDPTIAISNTGGKGPILFRGNYPAYVRMDDTATLSNRFSGWIFDSEGYTSPTNKFPNIISKNYTLLDERYNYGVPVLKKSDDAGRYSNPCPRDLIGLNYAFNPVFTDYKTIGNYLAVFTVNGGIQVSNNGCSGTSTDYLSVPNGADPVQTICPTVISENKQNAISGYMRTYTIDRRFDYDLIIFTPTYYGAYSDTTIQQINPNYATNDWRLGRVSGLTYNGLEMAYREEYNIIGDESEGRYHYTSSSFLYNTGNEMNIVTGTPTLKLNNNRVPFLYNATLKGNDYQIDLRDKSTYHQSLNVQPHNYSDNDSGYTVMNDKNCVKLSFKKDGQYNSDVDFSQSNYPFIREYDIKNLPITQKLSFSFTPCSYEYDISTREKLVGDNTYVMPKCVVQEGIETSFDIDCRNMITSESGLMTDLIKNNKYNARYDSEGNLVDYVIRFKIVPDKYNSTHQIATFIPYILSDATLPHDRNGQVYWQPYNTDGSTNGLNHISYTNTANETAIQWYIRQMKNATSIQEVLTNLNQRGLSFRHDIIYEGISPTNWDIWCDTFNTSTPYGREQDHWRWSEADDYLKPVYDDDSRVSSAVYTKGIGRDNVEYAIVLLRQYVNNSSDNLSKNIFAIHTCGYKKLSKSDGTSYKVWASKVEARWFAKTDGKDYDKPNTNVDGATMWKTQIKGSIKSEDMNWDTVDEPEIIVDFGGLYNTCTVDTKPVRSGNTITWNYTCEWEDESNKYTIGEHQRVDIWVRIEDKTVYKFELWSTNQWK